MQLPNITEEMKRIQTLYDSCKEQLLQLPGIVVNSRNKDLPYVLNFFYLFCSARKQCCIFGVETYFCFRWLCMCQRKTQSCLTAMGLDRAKFKLQLG